MWLLRARIDRIFFFNAVGQVLIKSKTATQGFILFYSRILRHPVASDTPTYTQSGRLFKLNHQDNDALGLKL